MREETWIDGVKYGRVLEHDRIIKLLQNRFLMAADEKANLVIGRDLTNVDKTSAALVISSLIWAIENEGEK